MEHKRHRQFNAVSGRSPAAPEAALVLDQGGSSTRALLIDARGHVLARAQVAVSERSLDALRVEQDAPELLESLHHCAEQVLRDAGTGIGAEAVSGVVVGLCTQRASALAWRRDSGEALTPVLSWQDRRAESAVAALEPVSARIEALSGLRLSPHYGGSKLRWLFDHEPAVRQAAEEGVLCLGPLAGYLATRLCGPGPERVDAVSASRTQLLELVTRQWSPELCERFGIQPAWLPELVDPRREFGRMTVSGRELALVLVTGDQSAAVFAGGEPDSRTLRVNLGTGAFVQRCLREPLRVPGLLTSLLPEDEQGARFSLEGTINGAGSALDWCCERAGQAFSPEWLEEGLRASEEPPLFLNAHSGLAAPFWRTDLVSRFDREASLPLALAAVAESVLYLVREIVERMIGALGQPERVAVSGGLSRSDELCQRMADLLGLVVERSVEQEASARGLAWLCLRGHFDEASRQRFVPTHNPALQARGRRWRQWLQESLSR